MANSFSAIEAALEGFRLIRRRPKVVAAWAGFQVLYGAVSMILMFRLFGEILADFSLLRRGEASDNARFLRAAGLSILVWMPVMLVTFTAVYRAVLRPKDSSAFYLRLGSDELRQLLVILLMALVLTGLCAVAVAVIAATTTVLGPLAGTLGSFATVAGVFYVVTRMALAPAKTFADGKVQFAAAWRMTGGHFWGIFGANALVCAVFFVLSLIVQLILAAATGGFLQGMGQVMSQASNVFEFSRTHLAQVAFYTVFTAVWGVLQTVLLLAPGAAIYRALSERDQAVVETFA